MKFSLWLVLAVVAAFLIPGPATAGDGAFSAILTHAGIWLIFFLQGLSLPGRDLWQGFRPWRVPAFVLIWNFAIFPLFVGLGVWILGRWLPGPLLWGFACLAFLPTTIASAITFTALAGGSASHAIFATVASNVAAVLLLPLAISLGFEWEANITVTVGPILGSLCVWIVFPLLAGSIIQSWIPRTSGNLSRHFRPVSSGIIVFIVYVSFAKSLSNGALQALIPSALVATLILIVSLLGATVALAWKTSRLLKVDRNQRIAAFFCASQKSLATGLPLITAVASGIPGGPEIAPLLIPILCFHPLQLLLAAALSHRLAQPVTH